MKFFSILLSLLASWACAVGVNAVVVSGASTPLFYFVSTSESSSSNLLPLRINGGSDYLATLTGTGPIGQLYFTQGQLVAQDPAGSSNTYKPFISAVQSTECTNYGPLGFSPGGSTNKCALFGNFQIQSDTENSQLGAQLVYNNTAGFYACGTTQDIWFKTSSSQGPSGCNPVSLFTVPVEG